MFDEFKKYYNQTKGDSNVKNNGKVRDGTMVTCPKCGSELPINAKFCNSCGYDMHVNTVQQDVNIENTEDKFNSKLEESQNNINEILNSTKEDAAESANAAAREYEKEIKRYDKKIRFLRNKSLEWIIKCVVIVAIFSLLLSIKYYGVMIIFKDEYGIPHIIKESITELIRLLIMWIVMFGLVWYNRHKAQTHWNLKVISVMYFSPIILLAIWFYNKFMWMLGG